MGIRTALLAGLLASAVFAGVRGAEIAGRKMVWAHHTPWHTPLNTSLTALNYCNFPLQDSTGNDIEDWKREFAQAKAQGIDGFFPDLVADKSGGATAFVEAMHTMLRAAEGSDFQIGVCLDVKTSVEQQIKELKRMLDLFGNHPNYPHWNGRPVVNFYTFLAWKPEELAAIRAGLKEAGHDIFVIGNIDTGYRRGDAEALRSHVAGADMIYVFGMAEFDGMTIQDKVRLHERLAAESGRELMTTVYPGYYGAWLNGRNDFYQVHCGFDQAHRSFEAANTPKAKHLHFTTWNDHDETSLLPMVFTPANPLITRAYSDRFKGNAPVSGRPEVVFAYHREEIPGTLLRFEAMALPAQEKGSVEVAGRLLDGDGNAVAQLSAKRLAGNEFDRAEWLVPSAGLAEHAFLVPEFTVNGGAVRLPEMLFFTGWHQNAVTVKVAASRMIAPESELRITQEKGLLRVTGSYSAPGTLKRVTLWRNDRPVATIVPESSGMSLSNLQISGIPSYTVTPERGRIVSAVRKFGENGSKNFDWNAESLASRNNRGWSPVALAVAGEPDMKLRFTVSGADPLTVSASELAGREQIEYGGLVIRSLPVDGTMQNRKALNRREDTFDFSLFAAAPRPHDRFQLFFEGADGRSGWSLPVWPFADGRKAFPVKLVETATNLETPSGATGWKGREEFLSTGVPFRAPVLSEAVLSPLSVRGGRWDFENDGRDAYGDMPVAIPEAMFVAGKAGEGSALRFTGKGSVRMRLRTYPVGASTVDFLLKPDGGRTERQGLVTRSGWSDAVNIYLLPDGRIEAVRDGNEEFRAEKAVSRAAVPDGVWSRVRVSCDNAALRIYIDGKCVAEEPVSPQRCYGNCTWFLGKGDRRSVNFTGCFDALTVFGAAFAPGGPDEPEVRKAELFRPLLPPGTPEADEESVVEGRWSFPANLERRAAGEKDTPFSPVRLSAPVVVGGDTLLLGPGANTLRVPAEGIELREGTVISVPLLRFDRAEPRRAWYALLISIGDGSGRSLNFNFGSGREFMITANEPAWKIRSGNFKLTLPADLRIAKRDGTLIFMVNGRIVHKAPDDPASPYTKLFFSTSSPNRDDATVVRLGAPKLYRLR
ncbi:MAG: laminin G [Lentisphaeria bacterium]|nr:laminin G [Lentisphaeria bacterium]